MVPLPDHGAAYDDDQAFLPVTILTLICQRIKSHYHHLELVSQRPNRQPDRLTNCSPSEYDSYPERYRFLPAETVSI